MAGPAYHARTHLPGGTDPLFPTPGPGLASTILAHPCLVAFWKLNESSGAIAADSGPDSYDVGGEVGDDPPTWGQAAGPPGETSAFFAPANGLSNPSFPQLTGDFTLEVWANRIADATGSTQLIGQGNPGTSGVKLLFQNAAADYRGVIAIGDSPSLQTVVSASPLPLDTWLHIVGTRESNIWTLYINGVAEADTFDDGGTDYVPYVPGGIWIGTTSAGAFNGLLSYAAVYDCALSPEETIEHYVEASEAAMEGAVLTLGEDGVPVWAVPTFEVSY